MHPLRERERISPAVLVDGRAATGRREMRRVSRRHDPPQERVQYARLEWRWLADNQPDSRRTAIAREKWSTATTGRFE